MTLTDWLIDWLIAVLSVCFLHNNSGSKHFSPSVRLSLCPMRQLEIRVGTIYMYIFLPLSVRYFIIADGRRSCRSPVPRTFYLVRAADYSDYTLHMEDSLCLFKPWNMSEIIPCVGLSAISLLMSNMILINFSVIGKLLTNICYIYMILRLNDFWSRGCDGLPAWLITIQIVPMNWLVLLLTFLADRTNGRAIATLFCLSACLSVVCLWRYVLWLNGAS